MVQTQMTKRLSSETTVAALQAALVAARESGAAVCVALVDDAGQLAGFVRAPGAFLISADLSIDKAWTSAGMKMSTRELGEALATMPSQVRDGLLRRPRLTEVPGGVPIIVDGAVVGGVGVSGGSAEQDDAIAGIALRFVQENIS